MRSWSHEARRRAKNIFNKPTRVAVAVWVLEREGRSFYQGEATQALSGKGEAISAVQTELERLTDWSMLTRVQPPGDRRVWYTQAPSDLWDVFRAAGRAFALFGEDSEDTNQTPRRSEGSG